MLIKKSPTEFINFWVLESKFLFIPGENISPEQAADIPVDIDFNILKASDKDRYKITCIVKTIHKENKYPYNFSLNCEAVFEIKEADKDIDKIKELLRTALPLTIAYARVYIANNTAYSPLRRYMLPAIDVRDLINRKIKSLIKPKKKKNKTIHRKK